MEALFGSWGSDQLWQDRQLRFDTSPAALKPRAGEAVLQVLVRLIVRVRVRALIGMAARHR